ncbi:unnamed protein product [Closterium sp. Yama58-4]|nr:unnamed protein product [Closterium sp. Yama58-4]
MAAAKPSTVRASPPSSLVRVLLLFTLLLVARQASAANLPLDGCQCGKLRGLERARINAVNFRRFEQIGSFNGAFNSHGGRLVPHQHGSGSVNLEVYQEVGNYVEVVRGRPGSTLEGCCAACAASPLCLQYHWFPSAQQRRNANSWYRPPFRHPFLNRRSARIASFPCVVFLLASALPLSTLF